MLAALPRKSRGRQAGVRTFNVQAAQRWLRVPLRWRLKARRWLRLQLDVAFRQQLWWCRWGRHRDLSQRDASHRDGLYRVLSVESVAAPSPRHPLSPPAEECGLIQLLERAQLIQLLSWVISCAPQGASAEFRSCKSRSLWQDREPARRQERRRERERERCGLEPQRGAQRPPWAPFA